MISRVLHPDQGETRRRPGRNKDDGEKRGGHGRESNLNAAGSVVHQTKRCGDQCEGNNVAISRVFHPDQAHTEPATRAAVGSMADPSGRRTGAGASPPDAAASTLVSRVSHGNDEGETRRRPGRNNDGAARSGRPGRNNDADQPREHTAGQHNNDDGEKMGFRDAVTTAAENQAPESGRTLEKKTVNIIDLTPFATHTAPTPDDDTASVPVYPPAPKI